MTHPSPEALALCGGAGRVESGQSWAYRARQVDQLVQVKVVRLGTQRPARVLVRFIDDAFEGREEWLPPVRLKVPWNSVAEFRAVRNAGTGSTRRAHFPLDDPREGVAETVIEMFFSENEVSIGYRESGAIRIKDPAGLAARLGLDVGQLTGHPLAFTEGDVLIAPWEVTGLIVTAAACQNPAPILEYVADEERKAQYEAIHGRWSRGGRRTSDYYVEPGHCIKFDNDYMRPRHEILRSWCGAEAANRFDELAELRKEIRRVGEVAQSAIDALRSAGHTAVATRLQRTLGTPVAMLRHTDTTG